MTVWTTFIKLRTRTPEECKETVGATKYRDILGRLTNCWKTRATQFHSVL